VKDDIKSGTTILTIGHSTITAEDFVRILSNYAVNLVVDIRTLPRSRYNPQFNKDILPATLIERGIDYQHMPGLGGLRRPLPNPLNTWWHNPSFRGFADYMAAPDFDQNLGILIDLAQKHKLVLVCAEALP